jgi:ketosteroid isomerase-like protein
LSSLVERIEAVNEAIGRQDFETVSSMLHPDALWQHNIGLGTPEEGVYRGREAVVALLERIVETWEYLRAEPTEIRDLGEERFLVRGVLHAKHLTTESELVTPYQQALGFSDGLLRWGRMSVGGESENAGHVRRFIDAFNRGDLEAAIGGLADDSELHEWPNAPGAQTFRGPEGARAALAGWFEVWEWMKVEIEEIIDLGDRLLVTSHQRAKARESGIEVEIRSFNVYTYRDGKIVRLELFTEREPALEAAGLTADQPVISE